MIFVIAALCIYYLWLHGTFAWEAAVLYILILILDMLYFGITDIKDLLKEARHDRSQK